METNETQLSALRVYWRRRLDHLNACHDAVEGWIDEQLQELQRESSAELSEENADEIGCRRGYVSIKVGNTHRYVMLVGVCTLLEEFFVQMTDLVVADREIGVRKADGSWLDKHLSVLEARANISLTGNEDAIVMFRRLITIRNCVVHAWGKIEAARDPEKVREAENEIEEIVVSKDGHLVFDAIFIGLAIHYAEEVAEELYDACRRLIHDD